nr:uncharacterized protein LOC110362683 isoform X2 [Columba livia]
MVQISAIPPCLCPQTAPLINVPVKQAQAPRWHNSVSPRELSAFICSSGSPPDTQNHCCPGLQCCFSVPLSLFLARSTSLMTLVNTARVFPAQLTCGEGQSGSSCRPPVLCPWQSLRWECKPARFGFAHQQSLCCLGCLPQHTWKQTDPSLKARFCWVENTCSTKQAPSRDWVAELLPPGQHAYVEGGKRCLGRTQRIPAHRIWEVSANSMEVLDDAADLPAICFIFLTKGRIDHGWFAEAFTLCPHPGWGRTPPAGCSGMGITLTAVSRRQIPYWA